MAAALKDIYRALDAATGKAALTAFEAGRMGPEVPGHRPELATGLERSDPVLRLPGRGPADRLA